MGEYAQSACHGKEGFDTRTLAVRVMERMRQRKQHSHSGLSLYQCRTCRRWHIGTKRKGGKG